MKEPANARGNDLETFFAHPGVVSVRVEDPEESLMAALPVVLSLDARDREVLVTLPSLTGRWASHVDTWFKELARPIRLALEDHHATSVIYAGHAGGSARRTPIDERPSVAAIVGLGAEAALGHDPADAERALARIIADGELLGVEPILRFGHAGRAFIEVVEHVHHLAGPMNQSVIADSLRAALFGRSGTSPVSLTTREHPPRLGPATAMIWFVAMGAFDGAPTA